MVFFAWPGGPTAQGSKQVTAPRGWASLNTDNSHQQEDLPEVVLVLRTIWVQVGGVALLGGDPTVNMTARELAPLPMEGGATAMP